MSSPRSTESRSAAFGTSQRSQEASSPKSPRSFSLFAVIEASTSLSNRNPSVFTSPSDSALTVLGRLCYHAELIKYWIFPKGGARMVLRATFVVLCILAGLALFSDGVDQQGRLMLASVVGLGIGGVVLGLEYLLRNTKTAVLLAGIIGLACGLVLAGIAAWSIAVTVPAVESVPILGLLLLAGFPYLGLVYGVRLFGEAGFFKRVRGSESGGAPSVSNKILDTSVIIDGRVADLCETGFLEGTFILPQFILNELQHIADSADPLKRSRGRRGLDILNKIQKMVDVEVRIVDEDFPHVKEVDSKIVVLAKKMNAKVITNDLNLSKVAELQGVRVLNINELCNALKPVVLPGEQLRVFVLKEGKEAAQGVAYLDDGTMIVVDNAKRFIGSNVNVVVTSVLQTQAGRMIFTRLKEETESQEPAVAPG